MIDTHVISEACREHGLEIRDARLTDGLLELIPASLDQLPNPTALQTIASDLKGGDVRWVTLALDDTQ